MKTTPLQGFNSFLIGYSDFDVYFGIGSVLDLDSGSDIGFDFGADACGKFLKS